MDRTFGPHLGLSDLLNQDLSSYEYYHTLPTRIQQKLEEIDVTSFEEMQSAVTDLKNVYGL